VKVLANGRPLDLPEGATLRELLEELGLTARAVVVERNGEPVPRAAFAGLVLREGDRLELVRPVQGG
jgi:sulfur carrier protein